ncbi:MAG TPA: DUF4389 domain-containing protein [Dehalococcoidia bacterium]|nr:DUF4389 domain-containing protein [Dehalococcoidia bacterium]
MAVAMGMDTAPEYPVRFNIVRPASQSRLTNFPLGIGTLIRGILLIPHLVILYFLQILAQLVFLIATFAILFTGRYPEGMRNLYVGYLRWTANVYGYFGSLFDNYPPFSTDPQADYPLTLEIDRAESLSRLLNFPFIGLIIKFILLIPHYVCLFFLSIVGFLAVFIAQFAILFSGSFPEGMHSFVTGVGRWNMRLSAYQYSLTDKYPPFSLN